MKKFLLLVSFLLLPFVSKADNFCTDWGTFNLCIPATQGVDTGYGYDFHGKQSQGLADTSFAKWSMSPIASKLDFRFGGVLSEFAKGSPFVGINYAMMNPVSSLLDINPGIYGGKNFTNGAYFWGIKASIQFITPKAAQ